MLIPPVLGNAFEGMGKGMAVIEDFAQAGLALVAADDASLDLHVARNQKTERLAVSPQNFVQVLFEHRKHLRVRDDGMLDDFSQAAAKLAAGERAQKLGIGEYQLGRVKRSDQVLPFRKIYAGLSADGTVHLRD